MGTKAKQKTLDDPFKAVLDLIPALVWSTGPDGNCDYCSRVWRDYTGLSLEDTAGWGWTAAVHPDDRDRLIAYWRLVLAAGELAETEGRLRRFDGEYRWFLFRGRAQRDARGRIVRWYGTNTDIEDRKRAEDALRASELSFRLIVDTIPALVCTMTPAGELELLNQQILDYFAKSRDELKNWGSIGVVHEDDLDHVTAQWRCSLETGCPYNVEYHIRRSDGAFRWFHVRGLPLRDAQGRIVRWYVLLVDIDEAKRAGEDLIKSRARLAHMSQIMTVAELSASIAHEVNQPLASLVANGHACVSWLSADPPNLERARITAGRVIRDANSAAEVVRRIRALFRQAPPSMVLTDLNDIVREAIGLIGNEIFDAGALVELDLAHELPKVVVDRVQIQQALVNLARNALEAMKPVTDRARNLTFVSRPDGTDVLIQVRDSGSGITNPNAIFDPFFTTKESGMGIGLAICRSIVDAHGGRLWAAPNDGPGATFSLTLPVRSEH